MGCLCLLAMAIIMFVAMRHMYKNKKKNMAIVVGGMTIFVSALGLVRRQSPIIKAVLWMKAMIPITLSSF
jgi:hypothetical protein